MAKHVGIKLPENLLRVLKEGKSMAVIATFSEKGLPHTTPVHFMYPKGDESLLISIHKDDLGYQNMVWQKKVMINFLQEGNIAYSVLGRAGVVRAPSEVHPLMNVIRVDLIDLKSDTSMLVKIENGVSWSYVSWDAEELSKALMNELKELSGTL